MGYPGDLPSGERPLLIFCLVSRASRPGARERSGSAEGMTAARPGRPARLEDVQKVLTGCAASGGRSPAPQGAACQGIRAPHCRLARPLGDWTAVCGGPTETQTETLPSRAAPRAARRTGIPAGHRWRKRGDSNPRSLAGRSLSRCSVGRPWGALVLVSGPASFALVQLGGIGLWSALMSTGRVTASPTNHPGDLPARGRGRPLRPEAIIVVPG